MAVAPNEPAPPAPPAAPPAPVAAPPAPPAPGLGHVAPPAPPPDPAAPPAPIDPNTGKLILKERPAWLGESFYDPKTGEVRVEALAQNANDLKAKLSRADHRPPATAADYKLDFSAHANPDVKAAAAALLVPGEDGSPDPIMARVAARAHKEGVSQAGLFGIVEEFMLGQSEIMPPAFDEKAELAKLGQNGPALLKGLNDYADEQVKRGFWDDSELQRWKNWNYDAGDAQLLYKLLFDSGRVPEIKTQAMTTAASTPDAATLDAEQNSIMDRKAKGEINDAQAQALFDAVLAKREKLYGKEATRSWPPAA